MRSVCCHLCVYPPFRPTACYLLICIGQRTRPIPTRSSTLHFMFASAGVCSLLWCRLLNFSCIIESWSVYKYATCYVSSLYLRSWTSNYLPASRLNARRITRDGFAASHDQGSSMIGASERSRGQSRDANKVHRSSSNKKRVLQTSLNMS